MIVISEFPKILSVKTNLSYKLNLEKGVKLENEFDELAFSGKSNHKTYKQYTDKKGNYIKYSTGTSVKPSYIKIYYED